MKKPRSGPGSRTGLDARSGPTVPEAQRPTERILLRCPPGTREALRALASAAGLSRSGWLARAVEAPSKKAPAAPCAEATKNHQAPAG